MPNAIAEIEPAVPVLVPDWSQIKEQAAMLEAAGKGTAILPKGVENRYQVAAILLKGAELGLPAMYSLEHIALVDGKPVIQGQAIAVLIIRKEGDKAIRWMETTDEKCTVGLKRRNDLEYQTLTWTIEDAKRAKLTGKNAWQNYPRTMLRWRALAEGARMFMPDVIAGAYTPEELGMEVTVTEDGDMVIEGEAVHHDELPRDAVNGNRAGDPEPQSVPEASGKPNQADWDTLEGICRELREAAGKDSSGWKNVATEAVHRLMGLNKSVSQLTKPEMQELIKLAASQRDIQREQRNAEEDPEIATLPEDATI